jgi:hypothetical protein
MGNTNVSIGGSVGGNVVVNGESATVSGGTYFDALLLKEGLEVIFNDTTQEVLKKLRSMTDNEQSVLVVGLGKRMQIVSVEEYLQAYS